MENVYTITSDGELHHWGIKGQKWGIRRYQNKDGSLTPAGRKRYAEEEAALKAREKSIKNRERAKSRQAKLDAKKAELDAREQALSSHKKTQNKPIVTGPKSVKDMTNDELREFTDRMRLEKDFYEARKNLAIANPKQVSAGQKFMNSLVNDVIAPAAVSAGKDWATKKLKSVLGVDEEKLKSTAEKLEDKRKELESLKKIKELERDMEDDPVAKLKKEHDALDYQQKINKLKRDMEDDPIAKLKKEHDILDYQQKIDKLKKGPDKEQTIDELLSKYGDMSEEEKARYLRASTVIGYRNTILGKKKDDK